MQRGRNMRPIKYDAIQNDLRLLEMALYEVTKGQTRHGSQEAIVKKVAEYKGIIKRGTFTIDELEDRIFSRYGIINERSQTDTAIYDASLEMGMGASDPLASLFSGLFRKSQGLGYGPPAQPPLEKNEVTGEDGESLPLDELELDELEELDDKFTKDQLDEDFPENENKDQTDPDDDDLPF